MKKPVIFLLMSFLFCISLFSQPDHGSGFSMTGNLVYYTQGNTSSYLDLYIPGENQGAAGIGAVRNERDQKRGDKIKEPPTPVLIWLPAAGTNKFPTPLASFTGNGYAVASVEHDKDADIIRTISRVAGFLKGNSQKFNLDAKSIGIIQQVEKGYLAIIWQDGLKKLELLSDAPVRIGIAAPADADFSKLLSSGNIKTILGFFDRHLRDGNHKESDPLSLPCPVNSWADPIINPIPGTAWHLFPTPSRGKDTQGSFLICLPEGYAFNDKKYPVIYWLHGSNGNSREGAWMCGKMKEAMQKGDMPQTIVVFVQGLPVGWYNNSKDSTMPVEDVIIKDLIPYVDANYRTIDKREGRGIEGMSMGGYGSLHLGFKYPELFGVVSAIAPNIIASGTERREVIASIFVDDSLYFNSNSPAALVQKNASFIRGKTFVRLLVGDKDLRLDLVQQFHKQLADLKIDHQYAEAKGASDDYKEVISRLDFNPFTFWRDAFGGIILSIRPPDSCTKRQLTAVAAACR
jgi:enterochelin esterase-like enzyme